MRLLEREGGRKKKKKGIRHTQGWGKKGLALGKSYF